MMDCVLSGSLLVVFSLFCYAVCVFFEQRNSLSLSLSLANNHNMQRHGHDILYDPLSLDLYDAAKNDRR